MAEKKPSIVLVMDKPAQASAYAPHVNARWPNHSVYVVYTLYLGLFEFSYPRGMKISEFPAVREPSWAPRRFDQPIKPVVELDRGEVRPVDLTPLNVLLEAHEIWFASDPDHSGVNTYQVLLTQCLGAEAAENTRPAIMLKTLCENEILRGLYSPSSTSSPEFQAQLNSGEAKRYFDYNFNLNSIVLLGRCLRSVGVYAQYGQGLSKYGLQLLYVLRDGKPRTENDLYRVMTKWKGTGRYAPCELGSAASKMSIIMMLKSLGLISYETREYQITQTGLDLLNVLHSKCEDPDLPARLMVWQRSWPESKEVMDRYLSTFFGKLMRRLPPEPQVSANLPLSTPMEV